MLFAELSAGDRLKIGNVIVTLEKKTGSRARVSITTDHQESIVVIPAGSSAEHIDKSDSSALEHRQQIG